MAGAALWFLVVVEKVWVEEGRREAPEAEAANLLDWDAREPRGAVRRTLRGCRRSDLDADLMLRLTADMIDWPD